MLVLCLHAYAFDTHDIRQKVEEVRDEVGRFTDADISGASELCIMSEYYVEAAASCTIRDR